MFSVRLSMVSDNPVMASETACGGASGAHCHEVETDVFGIYSVYVYKSEKIVEIRRHLEIKIEASVFVVNLLSAVE